MTSPSQPPTIAPDGRITCPNCAAEWYDCTHLKLASSSTPPSPKKREGCPYCGEPFEHKKTCITQHPDYEPLPTDPL